MIRKPMLLDKISRKSHSVHREVIGLLGAHHGAGVTHTGIMISFYMGEAMGKKTAFLECNNHHDMKLFQRAYEWTQETELSFSFHQITCFMDVSKKQMIDIMSQDYECIIIDFGIDFPFWKDEFLRCNYKMIIGGQSEWNWHKLASFANHTQIILGSNHWIYLMPYAKKKTLVDFRKEAKHEAITVPFEINPAVFSKKGYQFMRKLFHE